MTDPQAAQLGAVIAVLVVLAFYGTLLVFLLLGACHLWLDLRERLEERRQQRSTRQQVAFKAPERMTVRQWAEQYRDDCLDTADVVRYLRQRDQRFQRALTDDTSPPPEAP